MEGIEMLLGIAVGVFIGWNLPQPSWAVAAQAKVVEWVKSLRA